MVTSRYGSDYDGTDISGGGGREVGNGCGGGAIVGIGGGACEGEVGEKKQEQGNDNKVQ